MALLPSINELTGATTTNAQQKAYFTALRNFLSDLLGTNSSDKIAARQALGIGLQSGGVIGVGVNTQLNAAQHLGKTIYTESAIDFTVNMPSAATCYSGSRIAFANVNFGTMFLNKIGNDSLVTGVTGRTFIPVGRGDTLTLESNGVNAWVAVSGTAMMKDSATFKSLLTASKYQAFPSGLIVQSGTAMCNNAGQVGVTFPVAYTTDNPEVVLTPLVSNSVTYGLNVTARSGGGFNVFGSNNNAATGGLFFSWMSFGY